MFCTQCQTKLPDDAKFCIKCGTRIGGEHNQSASRMADDTTTRDIRSGKEATKPRAPMIRRWVAGVVFGVLACFAIFAIVLNIEEAWKRSKNRAEERAVEAAETASMEEILQKAQYDPIYLSELGLRKFDAIFKGKSGPVSEEALQIVRKEMDEVGRILLQAREAVDAEGAEPGSPRFLQVQGHLWQWWDFVQKFPYTSIIYHTDMDFRRRIDCYFGGAK